MNYNRTIKNGGISLKWDQILIYIDKNINQEMSLKEIANSAGYSEYYFARSFKEHFGFSIKEYVQKRKLIRASEEILQGNRIIDVAMKFGWESHSGFSRAFKKEFDFQPSLLKVLGKEYLYHFFLQSIEVGTKKEELLEILKEKTENNAYLEIAYHHACEAYSGKVRYSGEEYVTHPLNVAILLAELEADENTVLAGLFCDLHRKGNMSIQRLSDVLPEECVNIIRLLQNQEIKDESVLLIRMAERLHNMRTIEFLRKEARTEKAKETLQYFLPLAKNIASKKLMNELNEIALKYCRE